MNAKVVENLARHNIVSLIPYESAKSFQYKGKIWLNANENPTSILYKLKKYKLNRYPEFQPKKIIALYSSYSGLKKNQILVHRGADEGIELLMRVFCEPKKDAIMFFPPTYGMYKVTADSFGIKYYSIETNSNWQLNLSYINKIINKVKLIYVCNPNNPTANLINQKDLYYLMKIVNNKAIVVIDEAYIEFCPNYSLINWINNYSNLVILRTMSKAFALAGARCGFTLSNKYIINLLTKVIAPYPLPSIVTSIVSKALYAKGIALMKKNIKKILSIKEWFVNQLNKCACVEKVFNSRTNYLLIRFINSDRIFEKLKEKGIILRNQNKQLGLNNCIRITIGTFKECKLTISILKKIDVY